jgi:hypothetical protein
VSHVPSSTGGSWLKLAIRISEENIHGTVDHAVTAQITAEGDSHADL